MGAATPAAAAALEEERGRWSFKRESENACILCTRMYLPPLLSRMPKNHSAAISRQKASSAASSGPVSRRLA
jgi:hypothetical protein